MSLFKVFRGGTMKPFRLLTLELFAISILSFFSCGGSGGGGSSPGVGSLSLSMVDATSDEFKAVYVTVERVEVHLGGNENSQKSWKVVAEPRKTVNLLELVNEVREDLGIAELKEGRYTQMRLILGREPDDGLNILFQRHDNLPTDGSSLANYIITHSDQIIELKTPSGYQTGIKIVQGFRINANETTELELDFMVSKSIVFAGNGDKLLLKPTIKVREPKLYALVKGRVFDSIMVEATEQTDGIPGVLVSAQMLQSNESALDMDIVQTATLTAGDDSETEGIDEKGQYSLIVKPDIYNIVVSKNRYGIDCKEIDASLQEPGATLGPTLEDVDFEIFPAATGSVRVNSVTIPGADDYQHVTLSFRKQIDCIGSIQSSLIEVKSFNIANNIESSEVFSLPADKYVVVASTYNESPKILDPSIDCTNCEPCSTEDGGIPCIEIKDSQDQETVLNVSFP
jgi:hypothetical protein